MFIVYIIVIYEIRDGRGGVTKTGPNNASGIQHKFYLFCRPGVVVGINYYQHIYKNKGKDISHWQWQPHLSITVGA